MKTNKTKILLASMSVALVVTVAVAVVSCQKEPASEQHGTVTDYARELEAGNQFLERIVSFGNLLESYANGDDGRETMYMAMSEAMVSIEALFNYTYSNLNETYGQTVALDTTLHLLVTVDDSVAMPELATFYGRMHNAVRDLYHSVSLPDKRFLILDVEEGTVQNGKKAILLHTVQGSVAPDVFAQRVGQIPFGEDDCWYWANNMGNCDGTISEGDAGQEIARVINDELTPIPPQGAIYYYSPVIMVRCDDPRSYPYQNPLFNDPYGSGVPTYCAFYLESPIDNDDLKLDSVLLNFHYFGEKELILNRLPPENVIPQDYKFFLVTIDGNINGPLNSIGHNNLVYYGFQHCMASDTPHLPGHL